MGYIFWISFLFGLSQSRGQCLLLEYCTCQDPTKVLCPRANLTNVPPDIVSGAGIQWLDLSFNDIVILRNRSFSWRNNGAKDLLHLDLKHNNITTFEVDSFSPLASLKYLNLAFNNITRLLPQVFSNQLRLSVLLLANNPNLKLPPSGYILPKLTKLDLRHCGLISIPTDYFQNMTNISTLHLSNNLLSALGPQHFAPLTYLRELSLSNNKLTTLSSVMQLSPSTSVELWGNPWHCDCELATAFHELSKTRYHQPLLCGFDFEDIFKINATSYLSLCSPQSSTPTALRSATTKPWIIGVVVVCTLGAIAVVYTKPVRLCLRGNNAYHTFRQATRVGDNEEGDELTDVHLEEETETHDAK